MKDLSPEKRLKRDVAKLLLTHTREDVRWMVNNLAMSECAKLHPHMKESKKIMKLKEELS